MDGDGHCGFHSVAKAVYNDAGQHMQVRKKMMDALDIYKDTYMIEDQPYSVSEIQRILPAPDKVVGREYYFNLPECAQLASEVYQRPLVVLEEKHNFLFVPLLTPPWSDECEHNPIVLKHLGMHYNALITKCDSSSFLDGAPFILNQCHSDRLKAKAKGKSRALNDPTYQYFNDDWKSIFPTCFKINIKK
jgi:hypothetical protein